MHLSQERIDEFEDFVAAAQLSGEKICVQHHFGKWLERQLVPFGRGSQRAAGERIGVGQSQLSRLIRRAEPGNIQQKTIIPLCHALGLSESELLNRWKTEPIDNVPDNLPDEVSLTLVNIAKADWERVVEVATAKGTGPSKFVGEIVAQWARAGGSKIEGRTGGGTGESRPLGIPKARKPHRRHSTEDKPK